MNATIAELSPIQLDLLKMYSFHPSEKDLMDVRRILGQFFANKLVNQVNQSIELNDISLDELNLWLI
jgi:hypothetical protein